MKKGLKPIFKELIMKNKTHIIMIDKLKTVLNKYKKSVKN